MKHSWWTHTLCLIVTTLVAVALVTVSPGKAQQAADAYPLTVGAALCDAEPASDPASGNCRAAPGITVRVLTEDGTALGACVTTTTSPALASCTVAVPYDTRLLLYEDEATVPSGYGPRSNPLLAISPPAGVSPSEAQSPVFVNLARTAPSGPAAVPVLVGAYACPEPEAALETCRAIDGVAITVAIGGVEIDGSPVITSKQDDGSVAAVVVAPPDATLTLKADSGMPGGLIPAPGHAPRVVAVADLERRDCDRPVLCAVAPLILVPASEDTPIASPDTGPATEPNAEETATATATPEQETIAVHVHAGTCARPAKSPRYDLPDLPLAGPPTEGAAEASPAMVSEGTVDLSLDALLATPHAINLHLRSVPGGMIVACGEIGGTRQADGSLATGLREMPGSGYVGIAHLAPDPGDNERTRVAVYVATHLVATTPVTGAGDGTGGPTTPGSARDDAFVATHLSNPDLAVNFRPAPSLDTVPLAILEPATPLQFLGETATDADGWQWYRFRLESGRAGWLREGTFVPIEQDEGT